MPLYPSKFWDLRACHVSLYLRSETWILKVFSIWCCHSYTNRSFWFAFYPIGFPWSTRREGWSRRKGGKGDLSSLACACLIFLLLSALLFNLCDSFVRLIFLHPVLQKHSDVWSEETDLHRGIKKATLQEIGALLAQKKRIIIPRYLGYNLWTTWHQLIERWSFQGFLKMGVGGGIYDIK